MNLLWRAVTKTDVPVEGEKADTTSEDICLQPPLKGTISCSGVFNRWTYNPTTKVCDKFVYGGCRATENVFRNQHACLAKCNRKGKGSKKINLSIIRDLSELICFSQI